MTRATSASTTKTGKANQGNRQSASKEAEVLTWFFGHFAPQLGLVTKGVLQPGAAAHGLYQAALTTLRERLRTAGPWLTYASPSMPAWTPGFKPFTSMNSSRRTRLIAIHAICSRPRSSAPTRRSPAIRRRL